jgi:hypothetical protein
MTCPSALRNTSVLLTLLLLAVPCAAGERCHDGPAGPADRDYLADCRPAPVSAAEREAVLRTLPDEGAVATLAPKERAKLDALGRILRFHARDEVYAVTVIDVPQAWTGLHGRAVLLVSLPALQLLDGEQLQALVAHEIGHEYWWDEWEAARRRGDRPRLRALEMLCDAVAVLTLDAVGIPTERLGSALAAVHGFNRRRFGSAANETHYPSLQERRQAIVQLSRAER